MFATPAYAQSGTGSSSDLLLNILPFALMIVIFYFLLIRPQRQQMKQREQMLAGIKRSDVVVTGGGIVGKVTKVHDDFEVEVEIAKDVKVRVARGLISEVRVKGQPAK